MAIFTTRKTVSYPNSGELSLDVTAEPALASPEADVAVLFLYPWLQGEVAVPVPAQSKVGISTWLLSSWTHSEVAVPVLVRSEAGLATASRGRLISPKIQ